MKTRVIFRLSLSFREALRSAGQDRCVMWHLLLDERLRITKLSLSVEGEKLANCCD